MVKLLFITPDYAKTIEYAARTSTATETAEEKLLKESERLREAMPEGQPYSLETEEFLKVYKLSLNEKMHGEEAENFVRKLVKKGHLSVGRHCNASFEVICSRACSHQLVRHSHLNYTQESQRYVKFINWQELNNDNIEDYFIIPPSIKEKDEINEFKVDCIDACYDYYYYISNGIPKEDARYILPNACKTRLVVSGNFQAWMDFIKLRTDKKAQWEIREIAEQIRDILIEEAPAFFEGLKGE
jgi:thymidylate synthase (FAD)